MMVSKYYIHKQNEQIIFSQDTLIFVNSRLKTDLLTVVEHNPKECDLFESFFDFLKFL